MQLNETEMLMRFIAEVPKRLPHVRIFRRNIVNAVAQRGGRHFVAKAGIKGQADAYAIAEGGRHVEIETKAADGRLAEEQKRWRDLMQRMRVPHLVLRMEKDETTAETLGRWIDELGAVL